MVKSRPLKSVYIHIPFCISKCNYCNFLSFPEKKQYFEKYFQKLEFEIKTTLKNKNSTFKSVYIGGGTPSLADSTYYKKILSLINFIDEHESTIEINPGTTTPEYLSKLKDAGFNRLSIGVQSFNNNILKELNRQHTAEDALKTVKDAQKVGFKNISIDLIYGLPGQTLSDWLETLSNATSLDMQHISTYGLKIEEDTEFHRNPPPGLPEEEEVVQMYLNTIEVLEQNGYEHYEISNFCKPGYESAHNLAYWNNEEYYGFGLGAHGYVEKVRYSNKVNFEEYFLDPIEKAYENKLSEKEIEEEKIFLGLRLRKGINISDFNGKYNKIISKYAELGLVKLKNKNLSLTPHGILLSNEILAEFIESG